MADPIPTDEESVIFGTKEAAFVPLAGLAAVSQSFGAVLPVDTWHPPYCGDIGMRIARDGTWLYQGSPIERPALVRLFSRLLRKDETRYVLVTPVECVSIDVEDVPFIAFDIEAIRDACGQSLNIRTNVGDEIVIDAVHPLRFEASAEDGLIPYVLVRGGLWARLTRALTIELVAYGTAQIVDGTEMFGVASGGAFFPIAPAADV